MAITLKQVPQAVEGEHKAPEGMEHIREFVDGCSDEEFEYLGQCVDVRREDMGGVEEEEEDSKVEEKVKGAESVVDEEFDLSKDY